MSHLYSSKATLPSHLNTGAPILLDPSCIVTKDTAHLYDRDFIPNVCLRPLEGSALAGDQQQLSKSLPSVPSNDDIASSSGEKHFSDSLNRTGRPAVRRSAVQLPTDFGLRQSSQGLNSIDSSPARARHSSCVHDSVPIDLHKRCATEDMLRCPSVDSAAVTYRAQLNRTASDPELNSTVVRLGVKRGRPGSRSLTPPSSSISPQRRKRMSEVTIPTDNLEASTSASEFHSKPFLSIYL